MHCLCRREELREAVTSSVKAQELLHKYSVEALGESLLAYVTKARAALGPPLLKVHKLNQVPMEHLLATAC